MIIGHSVSDANGVIQSVDEAVAAVLQRTRCQLIGLSYLAITHRDDLARNRAQVAALQPNGASSRIRKRYVCGEGDVITLEVHVSRLGGCHTGHLVGTLATVDDSVEPSQAGSLHQLHGDTCAIGDGPARPTQTPHRLWERAKDQLAIIRARDDTLGADLFADQAWTILLLVYVAEAECRIAATTMLADTLRLSRPTVERWIRALQSRGLLEALVPGVDALQLTRSGIEGVEQLLATSPAVPAL